MKIFSVIILLLFTGCLSTKITKVTSDAKQATQPVTQIVNPITKQTLPADIKTDPLNLPEPTLGYILLGVIVCCLLCSIPSILNHRAKKLSRDQSDHKSKRIVLNE